ncbi:MAG: hypothetical protein ACXWLV_06435, partial [Rhizomicrobium sp.]
RVVLHVGGFDFMDRCGFVAGHQVLLVFASSSDRSLKTVQILNQKLNLNTTIDCIHVDYLPFSAIRVQDCGIALRLQLGGGEWR